MKKTLKNNNMQVHARVSLCKHLLNNCDCIVLKQSKETFVCGVGVSTRGLDILRINKKKP